jgi:hypothetical protein
VVGLPFPLVVEEALGELHLPVEGVVAYLEEVAGTAEPADA